MSDRADSLALAVEVAKADARREAINKFAIESDHVERIFDRDHHAVHGHALGLFLTLPVLDLHDVREFVKVIQSNAKIRDRAERNVYIRLQGGGVFRPPSGGLSIVGRTAELLESISRNELTPVEGHALYESIHPFTDGNGRSGRAVWAWHMEKAGLDPFSLPFLHRWYYQSLELSRRATAAP